MTKQYAVVLGALLAIGACRQIIGIEKAEVDPDLSADGTGGTMPALETAGHGNAAAGEPNHSEGGRAAATGSAGAAGDANDAGAGGHGGAEAARPACERYCGSVMENCTDGSAVYTSLSVCLAVCDALPEGSEGDRSGNTVHCRLQAAQAAVDDAPRYCPIAGPGGNGVCGDNCEGYCSVRAEVCSDGNPDDQASCLDACGALKDLDSYSTSLQAAHYSGPHVQCRLYHVSAAAASAAVGAADKQEHCAHAGGAVPCR